MTDNLLVVEGLRKEFGGLLAVDQVDFTIPEHAVVCPTSLWGCTRG